MKSSASRAPVVLVVFCLAQAACGQSPLFNHANAAPPSAGGASVINLKQNNDDCPLKFTRSQLCAALAWTKQPTDSETGSFELDFWDPAHGSKTGPFTDPSETLAVKLWMPDMGHGSSPVTITHGDLKGQFDVTGVFFVMPGGWEIHVQLKNGSNVVEEVVVPIQI